MPERVHVSGCGSRAGAVGGACAPEGTPEWGEWEWGCILMDRVMYPINPRDPKAPEQIRASLKRIKTFCAWTSGNWVLLNDIPWNALQNTSGHVRLLANMLVRVFTGIVNE